MIRDVYAKMPHGVEAIKKHLGLLPHVADDPSTIREIDNVPLLVSLYTDATPQTIEEIIQIFQQKGEVVLSVGSSYREYNQNIFNRSDVGVAVAMLPGDTTDVPMSVDEVTAKFPIRSETCLTQSDILLHFELISLGTVSLLQTLRTKTSLPVSVSASSIPFLPSDSDFSPKSLDSTSINGHPSDIHHLNTTTAPSSILPTNIHTINQQQRLNPATSSNNVIRRRSMEVIPEDVDQDHIHIVQPTQTTSQTLQDHQQQQQSSITASTSVNRKFPSIEQLADSFGISSSRIQATTPTTNTTHPTTHPTPLPQTSNGSLSFHLDLLKEISPITDTENAGAGGESILPRELQLSVLLEGIRMGRIYLLNALQVRYILIAMLLG